MIPWSQWEGLVPILAVFYVYAGHRTESTSFAEEKTIWSPYTGKFDEKTRLKTLSVSKTNKNDLIIRNPKNLKEP